MRIPASRRTALKTGLAVALMAAGLVTSLPAFAEDKLTVLLDWFVNPDHAPLCGAGEGLFPRSRA